VLLKARPHQLAEEDDKLRSTPWQRLSFNSALLPNCFTTDRDLIYHPSTSFTPQYPGLLLQENCHHLFIAIHVYPLLSFVTSNYNCPISITTSAASPTNTQAIIWPYSVVSFRVPIPTASPILVSQLIAKSLAKSPICGWTSLHFDYN
jgi:hypothetical protein